MLCVFMSLMCNPLYFTGKVPYYMQGITVYKCVYYVMRCTYVRLYLSVTFTLSKLTAIPFRVYWDLRNFK